MCIDIGLYIANIWYWAFHPDIGSFCYRCKLWYWISEWLIRYKFSWYRNNPISNIQNLTGTITTTRTNQTQISDIARNVSPLSEIILDWLPFSPISEWSYIGSVWYRNGPILGSVRYQNGPILGSVRYRNGPILGSVQIGIVPCRHGGGWSRKINAWHLYTLMVYL